MYVKLYVSMLRSLIVTNKNVTIEITVLLSNMGTYTPISLTINYNLYVHY